MSDPSARRPGRERWQPWTMGDLRATEPSAEAAASASLQSIKEHTFRLHAELKAEREKALAEAKAQGHADGYAAGFTEGREAGFAQGVAEGREAGQQEMRQQASSALAPILPLAQRFQESLAQVDSQIADQMVSLALAVGYHLAGEALKSTPEQVLVTVRELLHAEPALTGKPRLRLHPDDLGLVKSHLGEELAAAGWHLYPDDLVTRGGCRVTSSHGELDATWETRWSSIVERLRDRSGAQS